MTDNHPSTSKSQSWNQDSYDQGHRVASEKLNAEIERLREALREVVEYANECDCHGEWIANVARKALEPRND